MSSEPATQHANARLDPGSSLGALQELALEIGANGIFRDATALAERVFEGRFFIAVVGQFKRGKSTLVNALVGDPVLPSGVVPVTAVVTVVRHGPRRSARVRSVQGDWREVAIADLAEYVAEEANPENTRGVAAVEVFTPSSLLASGMCLVDTPGLGSVFRGGADATRAFVPHVDAALVVLGADPPISEEELDLVEEVARNVDEVLVVLNKADRVSDTERAEAKAFTERILTERLGTHLGPILQVSARERLETGAESRDWPLLHQTLSRLARESGSALVEAAERRGVRRLSERLGRELDEQREALIRPLAESEQRIEHLRRCSEDAERALGDLGYLLTAEQDRLRARFAERTQRFLESSGSVARDELFRAASQLAERGPALRKAAALIAQDVSMKWLERWRVEEAASAEALYVETAQRFVELANEFLERLTSSGEPGFAGLSESFGPELGFRVESRLYYKDLLHSISSSPFEWLADSFRSRSAIVEGKAADYLERLLYTNATRIENDFNERVLESRRRLESELRARLHEVSARAESALDRARTIRAAGASAVEAELERLDTRIEQLSELSRPETQE